MTWLIYHLAFDLKQWHHEGILGFHTLKTVQKMTTQQLRLNARKEQNNKLM